MSEMPKDMTADVAERFRRSLDAPPAWTTPSPGTWDAIASELRLTAWSSTPPHAPEPHPNSSTRRTVLVGIGGLLAGTLLGAGATWGARRATDARAAVKRAILTPLEAEDVELGTAQLRPLDVGYSLAVDVPRGAENVGGYVEVWLINVDGSGRMVSVGVFAAGTDSQFFVTDELIDAGYLIVDLSNEEFDEEPRHSGDTIMRGELRA